MEPAPRRIDLIESAFSGGLAGLLLFVVFDICMVAADLRIAEAQTIAPVAARASAPELAHAA